MSRTALAVFAVVLFAPFAPAGLYTPDEPCPFTVKADGTAEPLPLTQFLILYSDAFAGLVPQDAVNPGTLDWPPTDNAAGLRVMAGGLLAQRYAARHPKAQRLNGADLAGYTATLIRLGGNLQAIQRLQAERSRDYLLLANLAHGYAANGDWHTAAIRLTDALDFEPTTLPGTSVAQMNWLRAVDRTHYRQWLRLRNEETATKPPVASLVPDALFEDADRKPIRYWAGETEAAKLPPDAVAVAQQLALWAPWDAKSLWSLAEVYLATGKVAEAKAVFEMCANGKKFGGPEVFRDNRAKALELAAHLTADNPLAVEGDPQLDGKKKDFYAALVDMVGETKLFVVLGVFAVAAVVMVVLQLRSLRKRFSRPTR